MLQRHSLLLAFSALASLVPAEVYSKDKPLPPVLRAMLDCRGVAGDSARLQCYDKAAVEVDAANQRRELVVTDRESVRQTRRSLFGLKLPSSNLLGDDESVNEITAKLASVSEGREGGMVITLDDQAVWRQIDNVYVNKPKPGAVVVIRKGPLGGFLVKINDSRSFRAERINR
jgi:hypothetical protein